jgi:hypothetical protein
MMNLLTLSDMVVELKIKGYYSMAEIKLAIELDSKGHLPSII